MRSLAQPYKQTEGGDRVVAGGEWAAAGGRSRPLYYSLTTWYVWYGNRFLTAGQSHGYTSRPDSNAGGISTHSMFVCPFPPFCGCELCAIISEDRLFWCANCWNIVYFYFVNYCL